MDEIAKKLINNKSNAIVAIGEYHTKSIQSLGLILNKVLNNLGNTVKIMRERNFKSRFTSKRTLIVKRN